MEKQVPVWISVDEEDDEVCGRQCPFLRDNYCQLFSTDLSEVILKDGYVWQNADDPMMQREWRCRMFDTH